MQRQDPDVVVVVGTGVSIGATGAPEASWLGLLQHGVDCLVSTGVLTPTAADDVKREVRDAFDPFDLDRALKLAELIENNFRVPYPRRYADWLREAFADLTGKPERRATLDALRELADAGVLLATTNYDNLLVQTTGLPAVPWTDYDRLYRVMRRDEPGILHLHGHWSNPDSVILGRSSYNRILADARFQETMKGLWLERTWIYVGMGGGLTDPNLGHLLNWGDDWDKRPRPDYVLGRAEDADEHAAVVGPSANLVRIAYDNYADLPRVLRSLLPEVQCWPFIPIDETFPLYRVEDTQDDIPFPSQAEYEADEVPRLDADVEVAARLDAFGWAYVIDVASVGKTTLALRMVADRPDRRAFYLDLATYADGPLGEIVGAARRLSRLGTLLVVDNAHHAPDAARAVWDAWTHTPDRGRLLLIASKSFRPVALSPAQDLAFFERHPANPAVTLRPTTEDLWHVVRHLDGRTRRTSEPLSRPPYDVLTEWHATYGAALGGFAVAVLARLPSFRKGQWQIPTTAAAAWARQKWLRPLDPETQGNLLCLAAFGEQELEIQVLRESLPHPRRTEGLAQLALRTKNGRDGQYVRYALREPGWGRLIAAATDADLESIRFRTAARDPMLSVILSGRLRLSGRIAELSRFWTYLGDNADQLSERLFGVPLQYTVALIRRISRAGKAGLGETLWSALETAPDRFADTAWATSFHSVALFLREARAQGREVGPLWSALEAEPIRLTEAAWATSLYYVAAFLREARAQGREVGPLWSALEAEPDRLAEAAWATSLNGLATFLKEANKQDREVGPLWSALEAEPDRLAEAAWVTPLHSVASFLREAKAQGREVALMWSALEAEPDRLAEVAWTTSLNDLATFLREAASQGREVDPLWLALEAEPVRLAEAARATSLNDLVTFLKEANRQDRDATPLWTALEAEPQKLVAAIWQTHIDGVTAFLKEAVHADRDVESLWLILEREPDRLYKMLSTANLGNALGLLIVATEHSRDTDALWARIESDTLLLARWVSQAPDHMIESLYTAAYLGGRDLNALDKAIDRALSIYSA